MAKNIAPKTRLYITRNGMGYSARLNCGYICYLSNPGEYLSEYKEVRGVDFPEAFGAITLIPTETYANGIDLLFEKNPTVPFDEEHMIIIRRTVERLEEMAQEVVKPKRKLERLAKLIKH